MLSCEWAKSSYSAESACIEAAWRTATASMSNGNCAEVAAWRKADASYGSGACAEVAAWRKSSPSFSNGNCAEVGNGEQVVAVRDTKEAHLGEERTVLEFSPAAWRQFLDCLR